MINLKNLVLGIGIVVVFALTLWQGIEAFHPSPQYNDFCEDSFARPIAPGENMTQSLCEEQGGQWREYGTVPKNIEGESIPNGYCDYYSECQEEYNQARDNYAQTVFIVSIIVALITIIVGYFILSIEPVGSALIGSGIWAIFWGSVINWRNFSDIWRFLLLAVALVLLIWLTIRLNKKKK